jgi:hypothetical protein
MMAIKLPNLKVTFPKDTLILPIHENMEKSGLEGDNTLEIAMTNEIRANMIRNTSKGEICSKLDILYLKIRINHNQFDLPASSLSFLNL